MKIIRRIAISFSIYSRIPMPRVEWKEDDMSSSLDFFPLVGLVIGVLEFLFNSPQASMFLNPLARVFISVLIPIAVTGGFHVDGFMDTSDALGSYGDKEKKLEILKDPHIGAFSVIALVKLLLAALASASVILTSEKITLQTVLVCSLVFVISRCASGLTSIFFEKAKIIGMLQSEAGRRRKSTVMLLVIQLILSSVTMLILDLRTAVAVICVLILFTIFYKMKTGKEFGGVTGDTAGFYLCMSEVLSVAVIALMLILKR